MNDTPTTTNLIEETPTYRPFKFRDIVFAVLFFLWSQVHAIGLSAIPVAATNSRIVIILILIAGDAFLFWKTFTIRKRAVTTGEDTSQPISVKNILKILGITILMIMVTAFISSLLGIEGTENQDALDQFFGSIPLLAALHIIIIAPICEDMCFRYCLLRPGKVWWLRFILTGLLFVGIHVVPGEPLETIFAYLTPVCFLHATRLVSGSVKYSLMLHMFYNTVVVGLMIVTIITT